MNKTSSFYYLYPLPNLPRQLAGEGAESKASRIILLNFRKGCLMIIYMYFNEKNNCNREFKYRYGNKDRKATRSG